MKNTAAPLALKQLITMADLHHILDKIKFI